MPKIQTQFLTAILAGALLLGGFAGFAQDQEARYLLPGKVDGIALLPPPPSPGSAEQEADFQLVKAAVKARTSAEVARANFDSGLTFAIFANAAGAKFQLDRLPKTKALLEEVKTEIGPPIVAAKDHWQRKRPYDLDPALSIGKPEHNTSYPSGHSTRGTVYAMTIAELFPEHKEAILEQGRQIGWDRVILAKHFLSDVQAGRVFGQAMFREMKETPAFQKDLQAARQEVAAFTPSTPSTP